MTMDVEAARPRAFALRLLPQEQSGPTLLRAVPSLFQVRDVASYSPDFALGHSLPH